MAICGVLYGANRLLAPPGEFFRGYFADVLAGCVILAAANLLLAAGKIRPLRALAPCLALCFACGIFWELVTPLYLPRSVSDAWDIAAYMAGGAIWWLLCKIKRKC